jgi:hypothetical protein
MSEWRKSLHVNFVSMAFVCEISRERFLLFSVAAMNSEGS